jgi:Mce-associated membrane protein
VTDAPDATDPAEPGRRVAPSLVAGRSLRVVLLVMCVVLAVAVGVAWWRTHDDPPAAGADALTSSSAREDGRQAAARLTRTVLSYDWRTLDEDVAAASKVSAPSFRAQYARAMSGVRAQTVRNRVTLTAAPVDTAIVSASGSRLVALVFVDQTTTARGSANRRLDQNRVLVTLTRHGGEWRVSKMDVF